MKRILVGIKRVVNYNVRVRVKPDGSGVVTDGVKMSINPFDEIALEEALRIKERGGAEEVIVATVGPADCQQQLRTALAMGADRDLHGQADGVVEPLIAARALLKLIEREKRAPVGVRVVGFPEERGLAARTAPQVRGVRAGVLAPDPPQLLEDGVLGGP